MADTDTETLPNGTGGLSAAEEEDERLKQRPADIDADVREMERRKRVEALMSSKLFREELERVLDQQMNEGADAPLLQRIKEMVGGRLHTGSMRGPSCVLPINDIRGIEGIGYEKGEKILRCKLAAVYRLVDLFGWTQTGQGGQITARLNTAVEQVLTTPRGLLPHELTASSLVKVDMQGVVQDQGTTNFPVNVAGFSVHASVHAARPDIRCVLHVRSAAALAVSSTKQGLLPLSNEAALLGDVAYHQVPPGVLDNEERDKMVRILGPTCKLLFLTSNGALCCGETLEEAFYQAKNLVAACEVQLRLASLPLDSLILIDDETRKQIYEASRKPPLEGAKWRVGGEEFEALMRMLDNAGFRTGYIYRHPLIKNDVPKPKSDVEVPPAVSSLGYLLEEEEMYKQGLWKKGQGKTGERTRWLNSPNVYQKVEVLETGTSDPKKITKWVDANNEEWVQDGSPAHSSTPVKIDTLQFVPMKTNPKEFKALQQQIKDNRRADKISAGPQSHILEGVTWDEANKLNQAAEDASHTHTGDHVVLMGAASKGIIQRGYQHNATVYSAPYARNPFDHVTDREIDEYRRTVERRQRTGDYDTDLSESEAISAAQVTSPVSETEEESRDEHRVLRIETKQAPVRSQPEVVLSDVDTSDFLHAERIHAERTKGTTQASNAPVRPRAPTPKLTPNTTFSSSKSTKRNYPRNANFDSIVKIYDSPETSPLEDKKSGHPKCKVSLNSRLLSSSDSVRADALEVYQPGHGSSRSSLYSVPSLEWDARNKSEFLFRTRSLPRQSRKANKSRLFRTNSHAGFINSFIKDPEPPHFHLPRCRACGASNNSYAWELSRNFVEKRSGESSSSVDNVSQKCLKEMPKEIDVVNVIQKELPVYKVTDAIKESDSEFVESQEFTEDCYLGDMQTSYSSENLTVIEKTTAKVDSLREQLQKLSPVDEEFKKVYNKVVIQLNEKFEDLHRAEVAVADPDIPDDHLAEKVMTTDIAKWSSVVENSTEEVDIDKIDSLETMHGDYLNFSDDMDFTQAVYESPVKDLVEKDIRDYSVPINFYCEDYGNEDSIRSPRKKRQPVKTTILEPILEESKSSNGDESNLTQSNESAKVNVKISGVGTDFKVDVLLSDISETAENEIITKVTEPLQVTKKTTDEISKCIAEEIIEDIYRQDTDNETKSISKQILSDVFEKVVNVSQLNQELVKSAEKTKLTSHILETAYLYNRTPDYFVLEEGSDVTTFNLENVTNTAVETAMGMYLEEAVCTETEVMDDQESVINLVYENVFEIISNDARSDSIGLSAGKFSSDSVVTYDRIPQGPHIDTLVMQKNKEILQFEAALVKTGVSSKNNKLATEPEPNHKYEGLKMYVLQPSENIDNLKSEMAETESYKITNISGTESNVDQEVIICKMFQPQEILELQTEAGKVDTKVSLSSSREYSLGSTIPEVPSFNTTLEFEKYEAVSEIIGLLLATIDFSEVTDIDVVRDVECLKQERDIKLFDSSADEDVKPLNDIYDIKFDGNEKDSLEHIVVTNVVNLENLEHSTKRNEQFENDKDKSCERTEMRITIQTTEINEEYSEQSTENSLAGSDQETFSITKIVQNLDNQIINHNDPEVTDSSQMSENEQIIEAIIYYVFERTFSLMMNKAKANNCKNTKKVVTVVDVEDILFTAKPLWEFDVVVETSVQPECHENYASNVFKQPEREPGLQDCNKTDRESRDHKDNHIIQPLKIQLTSEKYLIKTETSGLISNNEVIEIEIVESTKIALDYEEKADVSVTLKSFHRIDGEMEEQEEVIPVVNTSRSRVELNVNAEKNQNINEEIIPSDDENTSKQEQDLDSAFHEENIQIYDEDVYIPRTYLDPNIAVVSIKECNEKNDTIVEKNCLATASHFETNVEDTLLVMTVHPDHDIVAGSPDVVAQIEESLSKKPPNKEIGEPSSRFLSLTDSIRTGTLPKNQDIDEIVPESVKSVVSSVLDEEVDDEALQKMLEELRDPDNTTVQSRQTEFRVEITLPFSYENIRPVFLNKDEIYDGQRQAFIEYAYSILEEILDKINEDNFPGDDSFYTDEDSVTPTHQLNKTFVQYDQSYQELEIYEDVEQGSTMVVQHIVNDIFENSFVANEMSFDDTEECSTVQTWMDETFVLQNPERYVDMNTAFVEDATDYHNSRFSSPVRENSKIFDTCDESPIVGTSHGFSREDLRVICEKDDRVSESPFAERNSVISMSQSVHSGGVTYWVSFDEHLSELQERSLKGSRKRCSENSMPSFFAISFETSGSAENISRSSWDEQGVKRSGILCESLTDSKSKSDANKSLYSIVTNEDYHTACTSKADSFKTCEGSRTPVEETNSQLMAPEENPREVLLYNTTKDHLTARPYKRQYSSWPPFEETLFYRLLSKFRMSESFDPSDLENGDSGCS